MIAIISKNPLKYGTKRNQTFNDARRQMKCKILLLLLGGFVDMLDARKCINKNNHHKVA